jgi:hypothetical protein
VVVPSASDGASWSASRSQSAATPSRSLIRPEHVLEAPPFDQGSRVGQAEAAGRRLHTDRGVWVRLTGRSDATTVERRSGLLPGVTMTCIEVTFSRISGKPESRTRQVDAATQKEAVAVVRTMLTNEGVIADKACGFSTHECPDDGTVS